MFVYRIGPGLPNSTHSSFFSKRKEEGVKEVATKGEEKVTTPLKKQTRVVESDSPVLKQQRKRRRILVDSESEEEEQEVSSSSHGASLENDKGCHDDRPAREEEGELMSGSNGSIEQVTSGGGGGGGGGGITSPVKSSLPAMPSNGALLKTPPKRQTGKPFPSPPSLPPSCLPSSCSDQLASTLE